VEDHRVLSDTNRSIELLLPGLPLGLYLHSSSRRRLGSVTVRLSSKTDYALRALVHLVDHYRSAPVSIREIAHSNAIPRRFLEQIMLDLKRKGLVKSVPGRNGGYVLGKPPGQITMGEVVRHFDGVLAPVGCVSVTDYQPCTEQPTCRFRRVLLDIRNYTAKLMDAMTLEDVAKERPVDRNEVFLDGDVHE
jgi:Rrf2 family protein